MTKAKAALEQVEQDELHWFVRDRGSKAAHHFDYSAPLPDRALCGHRFNEVLWEDEERPTRVCTRCQARMPSHEADWWRTRAEREHKLRRAAHARILGLESELRQARDVEARLRPTPADAAEEEPLNWFVKDRRSAFAHHLDYAAPEQDRALCGHLFDLIVDQGPDRPRAVCRRCQSALPAHEARVWQGRAEAAASRLEAGRAAAREQARLLSEAKRAAGEANAAADEMVRRLRREVANTARSRDELVERLERKVRNQAKEITRLLASRSGRSLVRLGAVTSVGERAPRPTAPRTLAASAVTRPSGAVVPDPAQSLAQSPARTLRDRHFAGGRNWFDTQPHEE